MLHKFKLLYLFFLLSFVIFSCAKKGLITETYDKDFYQVKKLLPENSIQDSKANFIVYSDNQAGWRVQHLFLNKSKWTSPKMLIFPFYELYLLANGFIGGINALRDMPDYGKKERVMMRNAIYSAAQKTDAAFILNIGDINAYDGRRPDHWKTFLQENKQDHNLLNEIPCLPVIGNHEYANDLKYGYPNYKGIFDYPRFYVIEFPHAAIYVLDSNFILDQNQFLENDIQDDLFAKWFVRANSSDSLSWLEKNFIEYDKPLKIVAMHHPPVTFGKHYQDWHNPAFGNALIEKRNKLLELFHKFKVDVVFSGHEHFYQYNTSTFKDRKIHFFVGGGGGTPLRNPPDEATQSAILKEYKIAGHDVQNVSISKIFHYYTVNIDNDKMSIEVVKVNKNNEQPIEKIEIRSQRN